MNDIVFGSYESCTLCPRKCGVNRYQRTGFCGCGTSVIAARAALHFWEEPCISGVNGSGAVFFSGCTLRCCFCQNHEISSGLSGAEISERRLADIFLELQDAGAHNISLITATHFLPGILRALDMVKTRLTIPVVYNCGGYENTETIRALDGYVDIWLPDLKYFDSGLSAKYSSAPDYFEKASAAIRAMIEQTGAPVFCEYEPGYRLMTSGVIIRHMVLPSHKEDSIRLLHWMREALPKDSFLISLLSQYTPCYQSGDHPEINRRITSFEYQKVVDAALELGLEQGFMQEKSSAREEYTPPFNLQGILPPL